MAIYPCSIGEHRYPGPQIGMYVSVLGEQLEQRRKLRLCPRHWGEIQPHLSKFELADDGIPTGDQQTVLVCASCGEPLIERGWQVFATCYPAKDDRKDYWFGVHAGDPMPAWLPIEVNPSAQP